MGFWQGLNEGLTYVMEDKARKKELEAARQERAAERQADIALEEKRFQRGKEEAAALRLEENKNRLRESLVPLYVQRQQEIDAATKVSAGASQLYDIFGDSTDPKVVALRNNPQVADAIWTEINKRREEAAKSGVILSIDLQTLLDNLVVKGSGEVVPVTLDAALIDVTDFEGYVSSVSKLSTPLTSATAILSPEYGLIPNAKNLEEGRKLFDTNLYTIAGQQRDALLADSQTDTTGEKQKAWDKLNNTIQAATKGDAAAVATLRDTYGQQAFEATVATDNMYTAAIVDTPEFAPFAETYNLKAQLVGILSDPTATDTDKATAKDKLAQLGWTF